MALFMRAVSRMKSSSSSGAVVANSNIPFTVIRRAQLPGSLSVALPSSASLGVSLYRMRPFLAISPTWEWV